MTQDAFWTRRWWPRSAPRWRCRWPGDPAVPQSPVRCRGAEHASNQGQIVEDALDANNTIARANRDDFDRDGVTVVNLMSAPGAGKTSLLERVVRDLDGVRVGVLEGDVQGSMDADRLARCTCR